MEQLFNSAVRVERMQLSYVDGSPVMDWVQATDEDPALDAMLQYLKCRLDLTFLRPGKDIPEAAVAGRAPDHIGVLFTYGYAPLKAGDRIVAILNERNVIPVPGTFEIRAIPDRPQDFYEAHHMEVQIIETGQELTNADWPGEDPS